MDHKLIYDYYINKGFTNIILYYIFHQCLLFFIISFSIFLYSCIDYHILFQYHDVYRSITFSFSWNPFIILCLIIISILWFWYFYIFLISIPKLRNTQTYYKNVLHIRDEELMT